MNGYPLLFLYSSAFTFLAISPHLSVCLFPSLLNFLFQKLESCEVLIGDHIFAGSKVVIDSKRSSPQKSIVTVSPFGVAARTLITNAVADAPEAEVSSAAESPEPSITTLKSEADLIKKKVKRDELRRKRLVRKRKLRKKGRWPPSKMAKLKNV